MSARARFVVVGFILSSPFWIVTTTGAQELTVSPHAHPPPDELAAELKPLMTEGGATAKVRATTVDLWFVKQVAVTGSATWSSIAEGTLVGAMRVSGSYADIRGRAIKPGVYTLRYGVQPQDSDHLAVSPHREFLLASPAASDPKAAPTGHQGTIDLAKQTTGIQHPAIFGLDPPVTTDPVLHVQTMRAGFKAVIVEVPTSAGGALRFGLILVGRIKA
jgi:hypothetical protein